MPPRLVLAATGLAAALAFVGAVGSASHRAPTAPAADRFVGPIDPHARVTYAAQRTLDRTTADRPDEAVGPQVHVVYALPSDSADAALDTNGTIASWLAYFNDWLAGQTGTRIRVDTFQGATDVSFLRLAESEAQLSGATNAAFLTIYREIQSSGFVDPTKKYLVAVPGFGGNTAPCGRGGGVLAVLFVSNCEGASWAFVAGHELFHTLGAVNDCAVHSTHEGHVTDPSDDLMFPIVRAAGQTPELDPGRDDYWGPPGDDHLPAGCPASVNVAESDWLTSHPYYRLTVQSGANGVAEVTTSGGFRDECTPDEACVETVAAGATFDLSAQPDDGYRFAGWKGGACTDGDCSVTVSADMTVTASFVAEPLLTVSVRGKGRIAFPALGATCSATCSLPVTYQEATLLRAAPAKGWRFSTWSGACTGKTPSCSVSLTADATATAAFVRLPPLCAKGKRSTAQHPCRRR